MSQYSLERKESVLRRMIAPMTLSMAQLSEETGISTWTLYHWRKQIVREEAAIVRYQDLLKRLSRLSPLR